MMKHYKVNLKGTTEYASTVIAVNDEKDLQSRLLHIAHDHEDEIDWQITKGITVEDFEECDCDECDCDECIEEQQ